MTSHRQSFVWTNIAATLAIGVFGASARADALSDFYAGKTVTIFVGSAPGGTYDLYARTIGRHLGKYMPGQPRVIVQNMPGAASYRAASHVFNVAPQDGTAIGALASALPYQNLIDPNAPELDVPRINWLSSVSTFIVVLAVDKKLPVRNVDDLRGKQTIMATLSPGQLPSLLVAATNETLGTKIKAINGHPSMNDALLAVQRGELDGYPGIPVDSLKRMASQISSQLHVVLQYGPKASADYPDAAYALDLVTKPDDRMLLDLAQAPLKIGYIYMTGPGVVPERVKAMREALSETYKDKTFLAEAEKSILNIEPLEGEQLQKIIQETSKTPQSVVERMHELYRRSFR